MSLRCQSEMMGPDSGASSFRMLCGVEISHVTILLMISIIMIIIIIIISIISIIIFWDLRLSLWSLGLRGCGTGYVATAKSNNRSESFKCSTQCVALCQMHVKSSMPRSLQAFQIGVTETGYGPVHNEEFWFQHARVKRLPLIVLIRVGGN